MRTIKIGGSYSGKISTGSYENANPGFYVDETIDDCQMTDAQVAERLAFWNKMCFDKFKEAEQDAIRERIERERRDLLLRNSHGRNGDVGTAIIDGASQHHAPAQCGQRIHRLLTQAGDQVPGQTGVGRFPDTTGGV